MALPVELPNAEAHGQLSEALRAHYKPGDNGTFILDVIPSKTLALENAAGLRTALEKERAAKETHERALKAFEGLDASKAREALNEVEKMRNWTPEDKVKDKIASQVKQVEEKHQGEMKIVTDKAGRYRSQVEKLLIDSVAVTAISKAGGVPELLLPHVRAQTKVEELPDGSMVARVVKEDGSPRVSLKPNNTGPMDIEELVLTLKAHPTYKVAFTSNLKSGTGSSEDTGLEAEGDVVFITSADAADVGKYRRAREQAEKQGKTLRIR